MNMINMLFNVMRARGINLPNNINRNDPNAILNYLMQNGKVTQEQYENARRQEMMHQQQYLNIFNNNSQNIQHY